MSNQPWLGGRPPARAGHTSRPPTPGQGCARGGSRRGGCQGGQEAGGTPSWAPDLPQPQSLTSIISKMLSGSRLPFPTFLMHVTTPLLVTDTSKLAKEQASS